MTTLLNFDICTHLKTKSEPVPERCKGSTKKSGTGSGGEGVKKVVSNKLSHTPKPRAEGSSPSAPANYKSLKMA